MDDCQDMIRAMAKRLMTDRMRAAGLTEDQITALWAEAEASPGPPYPVKMAPNVPPGTYKLASFSSGWAKPENGGDSG